MMHVALHGLLADAKLDNHVLGRVCTLRHGCDLVLEQQRVLEFTINHPDTTDDDLRECLHDIAVTILRTIG